MNATFSKELVGFFMQSLGVDGPDLALTFGIDVRVHCDYRLDPRAMSTTSFK